MRLPAPFFFLHFRVVFCPERRGRSWKSSAGKALEQVTIILLYMMTWLRCDVINTACRTPHKARTPNQRTHIKQHPKYASYVRKTTPKTWHSLEACCFVYITWQFRECCLLFFVGRYAIVRSMVLYRRFPPTCWRCTTLSRRTSDRWASSRTRSHTSTASPPPEETSPGIVSYRIVL